MLLKCFCTSSTTWLESLKRASYIVSNKPSISKLGLKVFCTLLIVLRSLPNPSKAKYSHWIGTITELAAVRAFKVISPNDGAQSINM